MNYILYLFLAFISGAVLSIGAIFLHNYLERRKIKEMNEFNLKSQLMLNNSNRESQTILGLQQLEAIKENTKLQKVLAEREFIQTEHQEKMNGFD